MTNRNCSSILELLPFNCQISARRALKTKFWTSSGPFYRYSSHRRCYRGMSNHRQKPSKKNTQKKHTPKKVRCPLIFGGMFYCLYIIHSFCPACPDHTVQPLQPSNFDTIFLECQTVF